MRPATTRRQQASAVPAAAGALSVFAPALLCLALLCPRPAAASTPPEAASPQELLKQLDAVSADPTQIYTLRNVQITRDRLKLYFNRGFIAFFTPVAGAITGAVFSGDGEVLLIPPVAVEKRNLAQFTQSPILEERITSAYLRFTDRTAQELLAAAARPDPEDTEQPTGLVETWAPLIRQLNPIQSMRILEDVLGERDRPYFHAWVRGATLGAFEVNDDERVAEAVRVGAVQRSGSRLFADIWCSFPSRTSEARRESLTPGTAVARSYKIDTRINDDNSLDGHAAIELESQSGQDRVVSFELSGRLKVSAASEVEPGGKQDVVFFQSPPPEESTAAARGNDWVVAVLPAPHAAGTRFRLDFSYRGNVIADVGNGVLYVGAHGMWYPNRAMLGASYDLTFSYPGRLTLVATGRRAEETSAQGVKHSRWISDGMFPVAGFNLGAYAERTRVVGTTSIEAYAAPGVEPSLRQRQLAQSAASQADLRPGRDVPASELPPPPARLDPTSLLDSVSDRAARAVHYFETLFGPFPYPRLALSQIPGDFGQGWPELVYLPTLSFLPSATRAALASPMSDDLENQLFVGHEIAHQWWGNRVGWKTYHDQWISEGFASYAAALELANDPDGEQKFHQLMRVYKSDLLSKNKDGSTIESGGPIWMGERLISPRSERAYQNLVYPKGAYVLQMLRSLMYDADDKDKAFIAMMHDFVETHREHPATTESFKAVAEKHMTKLMDLQKNGRLDWFFDEWVYGTQVPRYHFDYQVAPQDGGKVKVHMTITQSEVDDHFAMIVPVFADFGKGWVRIGQLGAIGNSSHSTDVILPSQPKKVGLNVNKDILER